MTAQVELAASASPSEHVVLHGNSPAFEFVTLLTTTAVAPLFHNVATSVALDVVPAGVAGNAGLFHVTMNVEGVIDVEVDADVDDGEVSAQPIDANTSSTGRMSARRTTGVHCTSKLHCGV